MFGQFVIGPESGITVTNGTLLYIGTDLYINSDANGTGGLADQNTSGNIDITGSINIERYLTQDGWHNISAPLDNLDTDNLSSTDLIFYYDETIIQNDWNFGWVMYDGPLNVMAGYDLFLESTITANYTAPSQANLNTGAYSMTITRTNVANGEIESRKGWNLLGNPYASPVDWLHPTAWDKSDINDAVYIWDPQNNNYTIFLGGSNPTGINGGTQYVPAGQGFWVQAVNDGTVSVSNPVRVGIAEGTPGFYKKSENEIRIYAHGNGYTDESLLRTINGSTYGFDRNMDASKLLSRHDSVPQIYYSLSDNSVAINTIPEISDSLILDLNFVCGTSGWFDLEFDFQGSHELYLFDRNENSYQKLYDDAIYSFWYDNSDKNNRFTLCFNVSEQFMNNLSIDPYKVFAIGNSIKVIRNTGLINSCQLDLFNMGGQLIGSYNLSEENINTIDTRLTPGWYIASIKTSKNIYNYKLNIL